MNLSECDKESKSFLENIGNPMLPKGLSCPGGIKLLSSTSKLSIKLGFPIQEILFMRNLTDLYIGNTYGIVPSINWTLLIGHISLTRLALGHLEERNQSFFQYLEQETTLTCFAIKSSFYQQMVQTLESILANKPSITKLTTLNVLLLPATVTTVTVSVAEGMLSRLALLLSNNNSSIRQLNIHTMSGLKTPQLISSLVNTIQPFLKPTMTK
eukprot:gene14524-17151_t